MATRPRLAVFVYGSLLDPTALDALFDDFQQRVWPVTGQGFERVCNQRASWRATEADQQAVLNVVRADGTWCNGLVVTDIQRGELQAFKDREAGYRLREVPTTDLEQYAARDVDTTHLESTMPPIEEQDLVLTTTGTKVDHDIAPIPSYLDECLVGASQWGETFLADFEATTETNTETDLATYRTD